MAGIGRRYAREGWGMTELVLNVLRDLAADYNCLARDATEYSWPDLELVAVTVTAIRGLDPARAFGVSEPVDGWVRYRSIVWRTDEDPPPGAARGPVVAAEWSRADRCVSVHLRQDPDHPGTLARWEYGERTLARGEGLRDGERAALRQRVSVMARSSQPVSLALGRNQPVIVYHVFWGADASDSYAVRRLFARFICFAEEAVVVRAGVRPPPVARGSRP
nr:hypothetical protein [uncultured Rhodopila sp.]